MPPGVRYDALNWEIQHKGKFRGYCQTLLGAFQSLPVENAQL
jgi:hypothetical protein